MSDAPTQYDAPGEYNKSLKDRSVPSNIPVDVMNKVNAGLVSSIMNGDAYRASALAKYTSTFAKVKRMSKSERLAFVNTLTDMDELKSLLTFDSELDFVNEVVGRMNILVANKNSEG